MQEVPRPRGQDAQEGVEALSDQSVFLLILAMLLFALLVRLARG